MGTLLDVGGGKIAHAGEGLVDFEHEGCDFVEAGFLLGGEPGGEGGEGADREVHSYGNWCCSRSWRSRSRGVQVFR